jgi:hypothetical protein
MDQNSSPISSIWSEARIRALWSDGPPADTEADLIRHKLSLKGTGNPYLLVHLLAFIGRSQALQDKFEQAYETLNEADYVLLEAAGKDPHESPLRHRCWLRYLVERGFLFSVSGWEDSAVNCWEQGRQMATDLNFLDLVREFDAHLNRFPR